MPTDAAGRRTTGRLPVVLRWNRQKPSAPVLPPRWTEVGGGDGVPRPSRAIRRFAAGEGERGIAAKRRGGFDRERRNQGAISRAENRKICSI